MLVPDTLDRIVPTGDAGRERLPLQVALGRVASAVAASAEPADVLHEIAVCAAAVPAKEASRAQASAAILRDFTMGENRAFPVKDASR